MQHPLHPTTGVVAATLDEIATLIEARLGGITAAERHVLQLAVGKLLAKHLERVAVNIVVTAPASTVLMGKG